MAQMPSPNTTTWSRQSRRIEPISLSAYPFCHGDRGEIGRSRIPIVALAPATRLGIRNHIHKAVTAAVAAGIFPDQLISLAALVDLAIVRALLRELLKQTGGKVTFYIRSIAATLLQIAKDWVRLSADDLEALRRLRLKLGLIPPGLTPKNQKLLRQFDDPADWPPLSGP